VLGKKAGDRDAARRRELPVRREAAAANGDIVRMPDDEELAVWDPLQDRCDLTKRLLPRVLDLGTTGVEQHALRKLDDHLAANDTHTKLTGRDHVAKL